MPVGDLLLRLTAPLILLALIVVLIRRKLYRQFPVFFVYLAYALSASGLRIAVKSQPKSYFVIYWTTDIIYGILALLVIREVFLPSLKVLPKQYGWVRWIMPTVVVAIMALAVWNAAYHPIGRGPLVSLAAGAYSFDVSIRWLEFIIFVTAAILDRTPWLALLMSEIGTLAGFGIAAFLTLFADLARAKFGSSFEEIFRYLPTSAYIGAAGIWLAAFLYKEPHPEFRLKDKHLTVMEDILKRQQDALDKFRRKDKSPRLKLC